jgi:hypothetical protein
MGNHTKQALALVAVGLTAIAASGCGGGSSPSGGSAGTAPSTAGKRILPVAKNPISNASKAAGLEITKVLVENNVSPATGKAVDDHLEIALKNTGAKPLDRVELYYKITDPSKGVSEGYYTKLGGFVVKPGETRTVHFDATAATDHYPVNKYSLYYTDKNQLVVEVTASAAGVKPATFTVKKDAGGAEAGVE